MFLGVPWLTGLVARFAFEFIEGNTVTRLYFMRLRRVTREAVRRGNLTPELERVRREHVPAFTHFLDIPILFVIVVPGAMRPNTWALREGVVLTATNTLMAELAQDWSRPEGGQLVGILFQDVLPPIA